MALLSVVIPAYNEGTNVQNAAEVISTVLSENSISHELIFVDDGSKDDTWDFISTLAMQNNFIHGVSFSRNFGKESAILAGLASANGDCCVVIDCDLQHPVDAMVEMYHLWENGFEIIEGVKSDRGQESTGHRMGARLFYGLMSKATGLDMHNASDYKLLDRKAVDSLLAYPEQHAFFRALSSWIGYRKTTVSYVVQDRKNGGSKWSTKSLIRYAVQNLMSFSTIPMQFVTIAGVVVLLLGLILGIQTLVHFCMGHSVEGFTTVILLILVIGSIIMISLGVIGFYIATIYDEVKRRPRYLISKTI